MTHEIFTALNNGEWEIYYDGKLYRYVNHEYGLITYGYITERTLIEDTSRAIGNPSPEVIKTWQYRYCEMFDKEYDEIFVNKA